MELKDRKTLIIFEKVSGPLVGYAPTTPMEGTQMEQTLVPDQTQELKGPIDISVIKVPDFDYPQVLRTYQALVDAGIPQAGIVVFNALKRRGDKVAQLSPELNSLPPLAQSALEFSKNSNLLEDTGVSENALVSIINHSATSSKSENFLPTEEKLLSHSTSSLEPVKPATTILEVKGIFNNRAQQLAEPIKKDLLN